LGAGIPVNVTLDQAGVVSPAAVTNPDTSGGSSSISPVNQPAAAATSQTVTGTPGPTATPSQAAAITAASQSALGFFGGGSTAGSTPAPAASTGFFGSIASSAGTAVKATQATTLATTVPSTASNVKTLANGAVTYVAKNGNTIEVAPGKTPYVIKKAK
jgi:hypothetical protein